MSALPPCPKCHSEFTYEDGAQLVCPECAHEWNDAEPAHDSDELIVKDANGNLVNGTKGVQLTSAVTANGIETVSITTDQLHADTNATTQDGGLLLTLTSDAVQTLNLTSATTLIPYFFVAAYGLMIAKRGETYDVRPQERTRDLVLASLAVAYTVFMIYAGGLKFIILSAVLFAPGTILYFIARREQGKPVFEKTSDWVTFFTIVAAGIYGVYGLLSGAISI